MSDPLEELAGALYPVMQQQAEARQTATTTDENGQRTLAYSTMPAPSAQPERERVESGTAERLSGLYKSKDAAPEPPAAKPPVPPTGQSPADRLASSYASTPRGPQTDAEIDRLLSDQEDRWAREIEADPDLMAGVPLAQQLMAEHGSPELLDLLANSGLSANPTIMRFAVRVARALKGRSAR